MTTVCEDRATLQAGYATETTCKILVVSTDDSDIIVSCNGVDYIVQLERTGVLDTEPDYAQLYSGSSAVGLPGSEATDLARNMKNRGVTEVCWTGAVEVTGLSSFTQYTATAAGSNSCTFYTAPADDDDFAFFMGTCISGVGYTAPKASGSEGMFDYIKAYVDAATLPVVGLMIIDDYTYNDTIRQIQDDGNSFHASCRWQLRYPSFPVPSENVYGYHEYEYNYALVYAQASEHFIPADANAVVSQAGDRLWAYQNLNWWGQWGDHEFFNNIGLNAAITTDPSQPYYSVGKSAWDQFIGRIQPPKIDAANGNAWDLTLGCVQIVAPDRVTNAVETGTNNGPLFGDDQIDDILGAMNSQPFKIFGMASSIAFMNASDKGPQEPMFDMGTGSLAEYEKMFTDAGGIVALSNGSPGFAFCTMHGDWHCGAIIKNENTDGTNNEDFISYHAGTITGSGNSINWDNSFDTSTVYRGRKYEWFDPRLDSSAQQSNSWIVQVEVYGSETPKRMVVNFIDDDTMLTNYTATYLSDQSGNLPTVT